MASPKPISWQLSLQLMSLWDREMGGPLVSKLIALRNCFFYKALTLHTQADKFERFQGLGFQGDTEVGCPFG